jgi:hypothetical protein
MKKWFANLKVAHKLVLMTIFFLLPDSIMLYMVLWGINDNIQFAQQEVRGNAYLRPLVRILHELPEHQRLAAAASRGDRIATTNLQQVDTAITRSIDELVGIDRRYGQILQFTPQALSARGRAQASVANLSQNWLALRSRSTGSDAGGTVACQQMVATVRQMITHAGDMSNLILDPDLDSYYLMDSVVLSIPQDQEQLARLIQASASPISASEAATDAANLSMQPHCASRRSTTGFLRNSRRCSCRHWDPIRAPCGASSDRFNLAAHPPGQQGAWWHLAFRLAIRRWRSGRLHPTSSIFCSCQESNTSNSAA